MANVSREQRQITKSRILAEATRLFMQQGFAQTSVRAIAAAANVSESSIFTYFTCKDDLLATIIIPPPPPIDRLVTMTTPGATVANLMRLHFAEVFPIEKSLLREFIALLQRSPNNEKSRLKEITHDFDRRLFAALQKAVTAFEIENPQLALNLIVGIITANFQAYTLDEAMTVSEYLSLIEIQADYTLEGRWRAPSMRQRKSDSATVLHI